MASRFPESSSNAIIWIAALTAAVLGAALIYDYAMGEPSVPSHTASQPLDFDKPGS
jgi:hypothetical protein